MIEYTAYPCAVAGELLAELSTETVDDAVISAAFDILDALVRGGPAEHIGNYADGPRVTLALFEHSNDRVVSIRQVDTIRRIQDYLCTDHVADSPTWKSVAPKVHALANAILARPDWRRRIEEQLKSTDRMLFFEAAAIADSYGVDAWEYHFERTKKGESDWYYLMNSRDRNQFLGQPQGPKNPLLA